MNPILKKIESKYMKDDVKVRVGDKVKAVLKVVEGQKERLQAFEGVVIAMNGDGVNKSATIRKISYGVGVEKVIPINSQKLHKLEILKAGRIKRAKLYYLRKRVGKAALKVKTA